MWKISALQCQPNSAAEAGHTDRQTKSQILYGGARKNWAKHLELPRRPSAMRAAVQKLPPRAPVYPSSYMYGWMGGERKCE